MLQMCVYIYVFVYDFVCMNITIDEILFLLHPIQSPIYLYHPLHCSNFPTRSKKTHKSILWFEKRSYICTVFSITLSDFDKNTILRNKNYTMLRKNVMKH